MDKEIESEFNNLKILIKDIYSDVENLKDRIIELESWLSKEITHHCQSEKSSKEIRSIYLNLHKILNGYKNEA